MEVLLSIKHPIFLLTINMALMGLMLMPINRSLIKININYGCKNELLRDDLKKTSISVFVLISMLPLVIHTNMEVFAFHGEVAYVISFLFLTLLYAHERKCIFTFLCVFFALEYVVIYFSTLS